MRETASARRQAPRNVASSLDSARELGIRESQDVGLLEPAVPVVPAAVVAHAAEPLDPAQTLVDPGVPADQRQRIGVFGQPPVAQQSLVVCWSPAVSV